MKSIKQNVLLFVSAAVCAVALMLTLPFAVHSFALDKDGNPVVVSLGDSYASGEGVEKFYGQDKSSAEKVKDPDWLAHRSEKSWSGQLEIPGYNGKLKDHKGTNWFFVASSGATTYHLTHSQEKEYSYDKQKGSYNLSPQLDIIDTINDTMGSGSVDYVTISIGGNDADFSGIITKGAITSTYITPNELQNMLNKIWDSFYAKDGIRDNLLQAYKDIQSKAGDQAYIIVTGYPKLLNEKGGFPFSEDEARMINESCSYFNKELNNLVEVCKSKGMKIRFASIEQGFEGHGAYSDDPYINPIYLFTKDQDIKKPGIVSSYSMHPNEDGIKVYVDSVQAVINDIEKEKAEEAQQRADSGEREIVLVLDTSGSMSGDPIEQTRIAARKFVDSVLEQDAAISIVKYESKAEIVSNFSKNPGWLKQTINKIGSGGGTNTYQGLFNANELLNSSRAKKKIIVLMSDGLPNEGKTGADLTAYANELKKSGIIIYTLGFFSNAGYEKASGQSLMESLASDGCHYEVTDANDLVFFFGDIADQLNGQKYIYVRIACPVDVTVSLGDETLCSVGSENAVRTSFGTLTFEENKSSDDEGDDTRVKVLRLKDGEDYDVLIESNGKGHMDYTIGFMDDEGNYSDLRKFKNIKIAKNTVVTTVAAPASSTVLNVDEDGDGEIDLTYKAEENGRGAIPEEFPVIWIIVGAVVLVAYIILIAIVLRKLKKKSRQSEHKKLEAAAPAARFCGGCGRKLEDDAVFCHECGTPAPPVPEAPQPVKQKKGINYKLAKLVVLILAVVIAAVPAVLIVTNTTGSRGAVRKIISAYGDEDIEKLIALSSDYYYFMEDDSYAFNYFEPLVSAGIDKIDSEYAGKLSYKISEEKKLSSRKTDELFESLTMNPEFDPDSIDEIRTVSLEVTGKGESKTLRMTLTLAKENGEWRLLLIEQKT